MCMTDAALLANYARKAKKFSARVYRILPIKKGGRLQQVGVLQEKHPKLTPQQQQVPWRYHEVVVIYGRVYDTQRADLVGATLSSYLATVFPSQRRDVDYSAKPIKQVEEGLGVKFD